jgi:hypothetical protein
LRKPERFLHSPTTNLTSIAMSRRAQRHSQVPGGAHCSAREADEISRIHKRSEAPGSAASEPRSDHGAAGDEEAASQAVRSERVEQKVRFATALLGHLAPNDPAARLLRMAVVRWDETLLDGLIRQLQMRKLTSQ